MSGAYVGGYYTKNDGIVPTFICSDTLMKFYYASSYFKIPLMSIRHDRNDMPLVAPEPLAFWSNEDE